MPFMTACEAKLCPLLRNRSKGHTYARHAVMQRTPLPVVARLLGHSQTTMTLRYAHTGETEAAAERIVGLTSELLGRSTN